jgi:hypothetical protein
VLPSVSVAQQYYDPGLLQKTVDRKPVDYQSPGIRAGSFNLNAGAELAWENNDNVFYLQEDEISDNILHARPWLNLNSNWSRHALNLSAFADVASYTDYNSQNYTDSVISLDGRVDVKRGSAFNYKASYMNLHEDRSNPDSRQNIEPTEFNFSGVDVDYTHSFNRLTATLGYQYQDTDYKNGKDIQGDVVDNQDRDRSRDIWSLRMGYDYSERSNLFVEYAGNSVDYDQKYDSNGYQRSSDGYDLRGGIAWNMTGVLTGDLFLQYISQDYDDPSFNKVNGFGVGANLEWTPTRLTSVSVKFANTPQETTLAGASGYYSSLYSARVQHELRRNILINARVSYTDNNYEYDDPDAASLKDTQVTRAGVGLSYLINRHFNLSGGYVYERQSASDNYFEYKTNRFFITLGGEL